MLPRHVSNRCNIRGGCRGELLWKGLARFSSSSDNWPPSGAGRRKSSRIRQASRQSSTLPLRAQEFIVLLASSLFMFGARLVYEADMLLFTGASIRKPPCGLTRGELTT